MSMRRTTTTQSPMLFLWNFLHFSPCILKCSIKVQNIWRNLKNILWNFLHFSPCTLQHFILAQLQSNGVVMNGYIHYLHRILWVTIFTIIMVNWNLKYCKKIDSEWMKNCWNGLMHLLYSWTHIIHCNQCRYL